MEAEGVQVVARAEGREVAPEGEPAAVELVEGVLREAAERVEELEQDPEWVDRAREDLAHQELAPASAEQVIRA